MYITYHLQGKMDFDLCICCEKEEREEERGEAKYEYKKEQKLTYMC